MREHAVDLLVADFELGSMSGETLAASVREHGAARPVVLISGLHEEARVELWPPMAFMPTILSIGALFSAIRALFDHPYGSSSTIADRDLGAGSI